MAAVLRYVRDNTRHTRRNQRVRLIVEVTPAAAGYENFNLGSYWGAYGRVGRRNSMVAFGYSSRSVPPFDHHRTSSTSTTSTDARFAFMVDKNLLLTYTRGANTYRRDSWDDGISWTGETLIAATSKYADVAVNGTGATVLAYWQGDKLYRMLREAGGTSFSAAVAMKDASAVDLAAEEDSFRIAYAPDGKLWLHYLPNGTTTTVILFSNDEGATWKPAPGAVTGIASAAHPGLCVAADGTVIAFAVTTATITTTRRVAGDVAFDTPVVVKDTAGVNVAIKNNAVSLAPVREKPGRVVFVFVAASGTQASEWGSADDGRTVKLIPEVH